MGATHHALSITKHDQTRPNKQEKQQKTQKMRKNEKKHENNEKREKSRKNKQNKRKRAPPAVAPSALQPATPGNTPPPTARDRCA